MGKPLDRVDGPQKVTGQAKYAGEFDVPGLLYGSVVSSSIARGRVRAIHAEEAEMLAGVRLVLTHLNRPKMAGENEAYEDMDAADGAPFRPLYNDRVLYSGQPVALVVADDLEIARHAASLVKVEYDIEPHETDLYQHLERAHEAPAELPEPRGDADSAFSAAARKVDVEYKVPVEHHNPMEPHASTVMYFPDGSLLIYDKTQGTQNSQAFIEEIFDMQGRVRVRAPFVGGAFGSGLRPQYQLVLAVMAALTLKSPVRVTLTRQQMFTFGYRPRMLQKMKFAASTEGKLQAISHEVIGQTSRFEDFTEHVAEWSGMLYSCDNVSLKYSLVPLDVYTPLDMRAPGAAEGVYALESAMDELAYEVGIDPMQLRLANYTDFNANEGKRYSSKELRACYAQGAERFGWDRRSMEPRSMRDGHELIGWGMATGVWEAMQMPASAKAVLCSDGMLRVSSATTDIGTGTYTVMTQIAAASFGLPVERVEFRLGDSSFPKAPLQGGSFTVSSVGSSVQKACNALKEKVWEAARQLSDSPFASGAIDELHFVNGRLQVGDSSERSMSLKDIVAAYGPIEVQVDGQPDSKRDNYATATHSAVFVEVRVDETLGTIRVARVVSAIAAGRIVNPKTAGSQIQGGVIWGIGQALQEETLADHNLGRFMNHNLSEYHVPIHADSPEMDVIFVEEQDEIVNALGSKGVGEIGIVGVAAAIGNAVFHATGRRVRELPITLDKVL
jgi:xanthine dehydrogenase YagR molybdenum-binding subunit